MNMEKIMIPIIKVTQSKWNMFVGVIEAKDLFYIAESDRIRSEALEIPKYAGYQRAIDPTRVSSIKDYLQTPDCTFPSSIIITIDSESIDNWVDCKMKNTSQLIVKKEIGAAKIVDGQHRVASLDALRDNFDIIVTIFIDLDITKCAQIFAKINSTQKSVNPSIAFQLFGYGEKRSPQKTAHEIADILNTTEGSPFYKKLRMLGTKEDWTEGTLSQSTFCKQVMRLYTKSPQKDENAILRGDKLEQYTGCPLRKYFIEENDKIILEIVWKYFFQIAQTWKTQWEDKKGQSILAKTTGFTSFIEVLKKWLIKSETLLTDDEIKRKLIEIRNLYENEKTKFVSTNYPAGHQGVKPLRNKLLKDLGI
jgi:DGQHR domain-containing protein